MAAKRVEFSGINSSAFLTSAQHILPDATGVDHREVTPFRKWNHFELVMIDEHNCNFACSNCLIKLYQFGTRAPQLLKEARGCTARQF